MKNRDDLPTLYDWAGGADAFERLTEAFYRRVAEDEFLEARRSG